MPHPFRLGLTIGGLLALAACDQTMQRPQEGGPGRGPALIQSEAPVSQPPQPVAPPLLARQELDQGRLAGGRPRPRPLPRGTGAPPSSRFHPAT